MKSLIKTEAMFAHVTWKEGRQYVAQCLNVDVSSFGNTRAEALKKLEEALALYFEDTPLKVREVQSPALAVRAFRHG